MMGQTNKDILDNALQRDLRHKMTDAERSLWQALRGRQMAGYKFRRQHPFNDSILDFVCLEKKLVVELDGGQHSEQIGADLIRTEKLNKVGFRVLRFWNNEVLKELESVKGRIWMELQRTGESPSSPQPSP